MEDINMCIKYTLPKKIIEINETIKNKYLCFSNYNSDNTLLLKYDKLYKKTIINKNHYIIVFLITLDHVVIQIPFEFQEHLDTTNYFIPSHSNKIENKFCFIIKNDYIFYLIKTFLINIIYETSNIYYFRKINNYIKLNFKYRKKRTPIIIMEIKKQIYEYINIYDSNYY